MTADDAAKELGVSIRRIRALLKAGSLKGEKHGRDWWIDQTEVDRFKQLDRKHGRPRK